MNHKGLPLRTSIYRITYIYNNNPWCTWFHWLEKICTTNSDVLLDERNGAKALLRVGFYWIIPDVWF